MKNSKQFKNTVLLLATFLSLGTFTGCGGSGSSGEETGTTTQSNDVVVVGESGTSDEETETTTQSNDVVVQKGWYVKLTVESDTLKDESTVFGYLEGASDNKDKYDSESLGTSGLCTTIYHEDFGDTKNYRSDYRTYKEVGEKSDTWMIKVNSNDANADITLSWNGITYVTKKSKSGFIEELQTESPELSLMRLVDVKTGDVFSADESDMQIIFNMEGQRVRTFEWILLKDGDPEPEAEPAVVGVAKASLRSMKVQDIEPEESDFELTPPSVQKR